MFNSRINSRQQLIDYCLRKLGAPVFQVSVDKEQIEDRIDDAFDMFWEYHTDASERVLIPIQITQTMIDNQAYDLPPNVLSVVSVLAGGAIDAINPYVNLQYQMYITDLMNIQNFMSNGVSGYVIAESYLNLISDILSPDPIITFNKHTQRLHIQQNWEITKPGTWTIVECYIAIDPNTIGEMYNNKWLKDYCTALIKRQWGENLIRYVNMTLPGGMQLNGQKIYDDAVIEVEMLENKLKSDYQEPVDWLMG